MNHESLNITSAWDNVPLSSLIDHIVQTHHAFCRREVLRLTVLLREVLNKHARSHPELVRIQTLFSRMSSDLSMHLLKEEQTLFPYITRVEDTVTRGIPVSWPPFGTVQNPIRMMILEHNQTGEEIEQIRKLSSEYTPPGDACGRYATLWSGLEAFDRNMQEHVQLEDNLLFPRAIEMEEQACAKQQGAKG